MQYTLENIQVEPVLSPPAILIYGEPGLGKTGFASQAPKPFLLDIESGANNYQVSRVNPKNFDDVMGWLNFLKTAEHDYKTVVIDSADWMEKLVHEDHCRRVGAKSITDKYNDSTSYGNGYVNALKYLSYVIDELEWLRKNKKMAVILTAHSLVKKMDEPDGVSYDRYVPKMDWRFNSLLTEWACAVIFVKKTTNITKDGKAVEGETILITSGSKASLAKNRLNLPRTIPFPKHGSWEIFINSINSEE